MSSDLGVVRKQNGDVLLKPGGTALMPSSKLGGGMSFESQAAWSAYEASRPTCQSMEEASLQGLPCWPLEGAFGCKLFCWQEEGALGLKPLCRPVEGAFGCRPLCRPVKGAPGCKPLSACGGSTWLQALSAYGLPTLISSLLES